MTCSASWRAAVETAARCSGASRTEGCDDGSHPGRDQRTRSASATLAARGAAIHRGGGGVAGCARGVQRAHRIARRQSRAESLAADATGPRECPARSVHRRGRGRCHRAPTRRRRHARRRAGGERQERHEIARLEDPTGARAARRRRPRATVAAYLMREVFDGQVPQHVGDIPTLLEPVFGRLGYDEIVSVLDELVKENALISFRKGRELHYRRQTETPSDVQPIIVDLKSLKAALRSGASQSIADIHRAMRVAWPELTLEALGRTLDELARTKQVDVLSVGTTRRYRLTAKGAA